MLTSADHTGQSIDVPLRTAVDGTDRNDPWTQHDRKTSSCTGRPAKKIKHWRHFSVLSAHEHDMPARTCPASTRPKAKRQTGRHACSPVTMIVPQQLLQDVLRGRGRPSISRYTLAASPPTSANTSVPHRSSHMNAKIPIKERLFLLSN